MAPEQPEPLIVTVIQNYHPDWQPPRDRGTEWTPCLCPFHGDSRPSASVSFGNDAFKCFVCDASGDAIGIIMREEGLGYRKAVEFAEGLSPGSKVSRNQKPRTQSIRSRRTPWSD